MRSASRFLPRFDALEPHLCLSDVLSSTSSALTFVAGPTTQTTTQTLIIPLTPTVQPQFNPPLLLAGVDGTMPTTPGVNLDVYPPVLGYGGIPIPQVPVSIQDPGGFFGPPGGLIQIVPPGTPNPPPYYPPPYNIPTYVGLMSVPVSPVT